MQRYTYDTETGFYTGVVVCQRHPLRPDEWLIPDNSSETTPPERGNHIAVFAGHSWELKEDHRGQTVYDKQTQEPLTITEVGGIPDTHTMQQPAGQFYSWDEARQEWRYDANAEKGYEEERERQWTMSELALSDCCKTDDYPLNGLTREELIDRIDSYRSALRNPARSSHPDYPRQSWRPQWPEGVKRPAI